MEYFYAGGGAPPYMQYRIKIKNMTTEAWDWCSDYDAGEGPFRRWSLEYAKISNGNHDIIQFEIEEAAIMFTLKFAELLL